MPIIGCKSIANLKSISWIVSYVKGESELVLVCTAGANLTSSGNFITVEPNQRRPSSPFASLQETENPLKPIKFGGSFASRTPATLTLIKSILTPRPYFLMIGDFNYGNNTRMRFTSWRHRPGPMRDEELIKCNFFYPEFTKAFWQVI